MSRIYTLAVALLCTATAAAGDWPQWLGPKRDGSSPDKIEPWKDAPKVLWKKAVGEGHSSPVVTDGRVFIHAKIGDKNEEELVAYAVSDGKELWRTKYERAKFESKFGNGPRATPAVVGDRVYTYGITGVLACFEAASGKIVWQVDARKELDALFPTFGFSSSPLIDGKNVIVAVGAKGASVVAFDRDTGKVGWKALDDNASYSSPVIFGEGTKRELVVFTAEGLVGLRPADGSLVWRFPFKDLLFESSATPVKLGDSILASAITIGSALITPEGKDVKEVWKNPTLNSYFTTPVPVGKDHVFMVTGDLFKKQASLRCVNLANGKADWSKEKVGTFAAALLKTGDERILMLTDAGQLVLLAGEPKAYQELARSKVCGQVWAPPALSNGKLFVRDDKELICLQMAQ
jgi:outer membrane protein assembly factor BamB